MHHFEIAGLSLQIDGESGVVADRLRDFIVDSFQEECLRVVIKGSDSIVPPEGTMITEEEIKWFRKPGRNTGYFLCFYDKYMNKNLCLMDVDVEWEKATITYLNYNNEGFDYRSLASIFTYFLLGTAFRNYIVHHEGVIFHASALEWNGKGIMFSAPSGTGKSTHVKLWQDCFGNQVKILNDDTPAVKLMEDGRPFIFGTPWSGSESIHSNDRAPLVAIVMLQQAPENAIRSISVKEAVAQLMPRVFLPYFDQNMMQLACGIFERIISAVPVYVLECRPDREAVELVCQYLK